jgi:hypothetical protein
MIHRRDIITFAIPEQGLLWGLPRGQAHWRNPSGHSFEYIWT